jgi:hypothetical protein
VGNFEGERRKAEIKFRVFHHLCEDTRTESAELLERKRKEESP